MKKILIILLLLFSAGCQQPKINELQLGMTFDEVQNLSNSKLIKISENHHSSIYRCNIKIDRGGVAMLSGAVLTITGEPYILAFDKSGNLISYTKGKDVRRIIK